MKTLNQRLEDMVKILKRTQSELLEELTEVDTVEIFDELLDETNRVVKIGELKYSPSHVLRRTDPTAYRCGLIDYLNDEVENEVLFTVNEDEYYRYDDVKQLIKELEDEEEEKSSECPF